MSFCIISNAYWVKLWNDCTARRGSVGLKDIFHSHIEISKTCSWFLLCVCQKKLCKYRKKNLKNVRVSGNQTRLLSIFSLYFYLGKIQPFQFESHEFIEKYAHLISLWHVPPSFLCNFIWWLHFSMRQYVFFLLK